MTELKIAWGVTGGGDLMKESAEVFKRVKDGLDPKITTYLSRAGEEVAKAYGVWDELKEVSPGGYYEEIFTENNQGASSYKAGRLYIRKYNVLFVSPATTNTIAKVVNGISDTLVTNIVALATKARVPTYIVPTDGKERSPKELPSFLAKEYEGLEYLPRDIDLENLELLEKIGATTLSDSMEIYDVVQKMSQK